MWRSLYGLLLTWCGIYTNSDTLLLNPQATLLSDVTSVQHNQTSRQVTINSDTLLLNPQATLLSDVTSVQHNQTSRQVTIHLAQKRRCLQPTFMVRLSGRALYLLDPVSRNHSNTDSHIFHYPPMHEVGLYFLEVLTLYCETLDPNSFASMCLVHPGEGKNVLTLPYSFEVAAGSTDLLVKKHHRPRWVLRQNATSALLPTRYQKMCDGQYCQSVESDIEQHNLYEWTDKPPYEHLIKKSLQWSLKNLTSRTGNESVTICMVGASHAGAIAKHAGRMKIPHVNFVRIESRYPQLFDALLLENCSYAVIGYGQWPLSSWQGNHPYNATRYEALVRDVLRAVKASNTSTQVFTQSMNLNGLGVTHTACPAVDYRHPPLTVMYNSIMARVSAEFNIPYIDMYHLQGPLWDISLDWSHPWGRVFFAEVEFVLHAVLSYSHKHHRAPNVYPNFGFFVPHIYPQIIRFSDSDQTYLYWESITSCRPLPADFSFGSLDFKLEYLNATMRDSVSFGPILPNI